MTARLGPKRDGQAQMAGVSTTFAGSSAKWRGRRGCLTYSLSFQPSFPVGVGDSNFIASMTLVITYREGRRMREATKES